VRREIERAKPDVAFNRVESLGGSDAMQAAVTLLLDTMDVPYTGNPTATLVATASKVRVKERLLSAGLPTPEWVGGGFAFSSVVGATHFILKSVYEHASFEMDDSCIVGPVDADDIARLVDQRSMESGRPFFAERFVSGREFNLSLLGRDPQVLPPAEIDFSAFPPEKPRIVGYGAKWDRDSFEFDNTPRRFDFPPSDRKLLKRLHELSVECWRLFDLKGYARVDFRCDELNRPWILEINTNPCLSPTSGFAAALNAAEIEYDGGVQRILDAACASEAPLVALASDTTTPA
jgi:D-alanine-D-alanine ligase